MIVLIWLVTIILALAVLSAPLKMTTNDEFKLSEFISLLILVFVLVVFSVISVTGRFIVY